MSTGNSTPVSDLPHDVAALGDWSPEEFRAALHEVADLAADYFSGVGDLRVVPKLQPGEVRAALPKQAPEQGEPLTDLLEDFKQLVVPNTTHWNHPGFMAYFAVTGSAPGILGELLSSTLNVNAMLWRTGPAPTELEEHVCDWLRSAMGLPKGFVGHINDTASIGSLLSIAAARHRHRDFDIRVKGMSGRGDLPRMTVYASDQAHSSIDKAIVTLGLGLDNLRKVPTDGAFRMRPELLARMLAEDRAAGALPLAIVATAGTTSTTSVDPIPEIAELAREYDAWLHVDAAYAGTAAMVPELRAIMPGFDYADSLVTNPHKWMFVPVDCSVLFVREPELLREAFSIVPDYLTTTERGVTNLMDYGVQLGRRFRALKLWFVMRSFGLEGLRARMRYHCDLAQRFAQRVEADDRFEILAPIPFSTVCFRAKPLVGMSDVEADAWNEALLSRLNSVGSNFVSHTRLRERYAMRLTVGNLRTRPEHLDRAWALLDESFSATLPET